MIMVSSKGIHALKEILNDVKTYKIFKFDTKLKKEENEKTASELGKEVSKK